MELASIRLKGTLSERLSDMAMFLQEQTPPPADEGVSVAAFIFDLRDAARLLAWHLMTDPVLEKVKAEGTRIIVFVPHKSIPKGANYRQDLPSRMIFAHWSKAAPPTKAITPSKHSRTLEEKHGGFWASDRRGIKPLKGAPTMWMYMPQVPR